MFCLLNKKEVEISVTQLLALNRGGCEFLQSCNAILW